MILISFFVHFNISILPLIFQEISKEFHEKKKDKNGFIDNFKDYKISIIQKKFIQFFLLTKEKSLLHIIKIKRLNMN